MAHSCNVSELYSTKYWCPGPIEDCEVLATAERKALLLGRTPSYVSLVSCSLSVLGSLLIIFSHWKWKDLRTGSRSIVTYLAIADFFTAAGYIIAGGNYLHYYGQPEASLECVRFQQICEMQSFITTWSSMSSFAWTSILATYLYLTIVRQRIDLAALLIPVGHVIAWVLPFVIVYPLLCTRHLGYSTVATSNWCYIRGTGENQQPVHFKGEIPLDIVFLALVAGKFWEIITNVVVLVFYGLIKWHIRKETKSGTFLSQRVMEATRQVDRKLTFIPMVFILLRFWGTTQFFYSIAVGRWVQCGCVSHGLWKGFFALGILQAVGDGGQGWGNAILYVFASKVLRERWLALIMTSLKWCCQCKCSPQPSARTVNLPQRQNPPKTHNYYKHSTNYPIPAKRTVGVAISSWFQRREGDPISFDEVEGGRIVFESPRRARYTPPRKPVKGQRSYVEYDPTTIFDDS